MGKYRVTITDTLQWQNEIEADSKKEAIEKATEYIIGGTDAWKVVKTAKKAERIDDEQRRDGV